MKKIIIVMLFFAMTKAMASIDFVTVKECPPTVFGKWSQDETQAKINNSLKTAINNARAKSIFHISYANDESGFFRSKEGKNSCIIATAWIEI